DVIDFCLPSHDARLRGGWYELEGVFGNKYRWIGAQASAVLKRVKPGAQKLRIRGHVHEQSFAQGKPVTLIADVNGQRVGEWTLERSGLFIVEANLPEAAEYELSVTAGPTWQVPTDDRVFSVNLSMIRLAPQDDSEL
ncbi:MAG TPA: hypothetical protein VMZ52_06245, partial [Bryobacteraceae bacterium]|nr:hypothetical protein [Bryobacteraceae bacterium]